MKISTSGALLTLLALLFAAPLTAQHIEWHDASQFPLYGKASELTESRYERLPTHTKSITREPVAYLGSHSTGLYIRFRSNSTSIHARWESTFNCSMPHMTDVGTRGLDLYTLIDGKWRYVRTAIPDAKLTECSIIENMEPQEREYMLYLSLYDGVQSLEIGVDNGAEISTPAFETTHPKPIVMYGTSILQGGCANRPGMAHTNIIGRELNREVINLGFSGNALLDMEIAELMASVKEPALFVMDYVPNASAEAIESVGEKFFRIVRDAHPNVPVVFVEDPIFPHTLFDKKILEEVTTKNIAQRELFNRLKRQGTKHIYYVPAEGMIGDDGEATVDGYHLTDLGAMRYVKHILPTLKKALKRAK